MDMQRHYKKKPFGFGNTKEGRIIRAEQQERSRREQRTKNFTRNRNLNEAASTPVQNAESKDTVLVQDRMNKLLKWKAERDRRRKLEQVHKKPVFKVSVVHHNFYSPVDKTAESKPTGKMCRHVSRPTPPLKKITRATQRRLLAKLDSSKAQTVTGANSVRTQVQKTPTVSVKKPKSTEVRQEKSFAPVNYKFKGPENLSHMPMFGRVAMTNTSMEQCTKTDTLDEALNNIKTDNEKCDEIEKLNEEVENIAIQDTKDSSIETVTLHLSSDEQDTANNSQELKTQQKKDNVPIDGGKNNLSTPVAASPVMSQEPAFFSPYIVLSRGKSSARKEQQLRLGIGGQGSHDIPTKDTVIKNLNISVEEEERTAQYYKFILNKEISRLTEICEKWREVKSTSDITEDGQYLINQAIGQTNLLIDKKFQRFKGLVEDCETGKGEMLVTCKDLQGFWDAMYMEIRNCDSRFDKLEKLRSNNWEEEEDNIMNRNVKKRTGPKRNKLKSTASTKPATRSSIRNLISAARKKKAEQQRSMSGQFTSGTNGALEVFTNATTNILPTIALSMDQNNSGIRRSLTQRRTVSPQVHSKVTPAKLDRSRASLLQRVQLSEASRKIRSPLTIIKISQMCKTPEVQLDETISYVNSDQTPGKSILKRSQKSLEDKSLITKTSNKVNFDDHVELNELPVDEDLKIKLDLSVALARIDSFDFDNLNTEAKVKAERRLDFENDSFDEEDDSAFFPVSAKHSSTLIEQNAARVADTEANISAAPLTEPNRLPSKRATQIEQPISPNARVLRNRTLAKNDTSQIFKKNTNETVEESSNSKENRSPRRARRRSLRVNLVKSPVEKRVEKDTVAAKVTSINDVGRRRSSRKSVRFNAEDCTESVKPVHPVTPHSKRSMQANLSLLGMVENEDIAPLPNGDLIMFETPRKVPARIRRSSRKIN